MNKIIIIALILAASITANAQTKTPKNKKTATKVTAQVNTAFKQHVLLVSDEDFNLVVNSAADLNGFQGYIMKTSIPANQIQTAGKYFQALLTNWSNQQKAWQKAEADSIQAQKDTIPKK